MLYRELISKVAMIILHDHRRDTFRQGSHDYCHDYCHSGDA